jgi:mono/diheme cytochrome c family protein
MTIRTTHLPFLAILLSNFLYAENKPEPGVIATVTDGRHTVAYVTPAPHFTLKSNESLHPQIGANFQATFEGALTISEPDSYTIQADAKVTINGKDAVGKAIALTAGEHPIRIEYTRKPGDARLQLQWEGRTFQREPIPSRAFVHSSTSDTAEKTAEIELGRQLVDDLNCSSCHKPSTPNLSKRRPIDLSAAGSRLNHDWLVAWLKNPQHFRKSTGMPALLTEEEDIRDVAAFLSGLRDPDKQTVHPPLEKGRIQQGENLFKSIGCIACHDEAGIDLSRMHEKTNVHALKDYLLNPFATNPDGRMPQMFNIGYVKSNQAAQEAENIARYVLRNRKGSEKAPAVPKATLKEPEEEDEFEDLDAPDPARGERLIAEKGCLKCHSLKAKPLARAHALGITPERLGIRLSPWKLLGPFNMKKGFKQAYPPETKLDLEAEFVGGNNKKIHWQQVNHKDGRGHSLMRGRRNTIVYLHRWIDAESDGTVTVQVGSDDQIAIWVNGKQVLFLDVVRGLPRNLDKAVVPLKKGRNDLLLKVGNLGGGYAYIFKLDPTAYKLPPVPKSEYKAADMIALDASKGCLSEKPSTKAANYSLDAKQRGAIKGFLAGLKTTPDISQAPTWSFYRKVKSSNCSACHELDHLQPHPSLNHLPPPLTATGDKLRTSWIRDILMSNRRTRKWLGLRMPHFGGQVNSLVNQFAAVSGTPPEKDSSIRIQKSELKSLLAQVGTGKNGLSCISCHEFKGAGQPTGERGREFTELGMSVREDWFRRWMRNPSRIRPGTPMPMFFAGMEPEIAEKKITDLWRVISLGRRMPSPPGAIRAVDNYTIEVNQEPIVLRAFVQGSAARSITVGLPGYVNYAFDSEACRLQYAWSGEFIDVRGAWSGRGGRAIKVLGDKFYVPPPGPALKHADSKEKPNADFKGFRLLEGAPEYRYLLDGVEVRHYIREAPETTGLVQSFAIANARGPIILNIGKTDGMKVTTSAGKIANGKLTLEGGPKVNVQVTITEEKEKK